MLSAAMKLKLNVSKAVIFILKNVLRLISTQIVRDGYLSVTNLYALLHKFYDDY